MRAELLHKNEKTKSVENAQQKPFCKAYRVFPVFVPAPSLNKIRYHMHKAELRNGFLRNIPDLPNRQSSVAKLSMLGQRKEEVVTTQSLWRLQNLAIAKSCPLQTVCQIRDAFFRIRAPSGRYIWPKGKHVLVADTAQLLQGKGEEHFGVGIKSVWVQLTGAFRDSPWPTWSRTTLPPPLKTFTDMKNHYKIIFGALTGEPCKNPLGSY